MIRRRSLLAAVPAAGLAGLLAGCGGFVTGGSGGGTDDDTLSFTTWGTDAELTGFRTAIAAFEQANPGSKVALNAVPYEQMFTNIDAQLQAGNPPDVFRVPYYLLGAYAGRQQLLDLTPHLSPGAGDAFTETAWAAVQGGGKPVGVPHHTDTSVILFNKDALGELGVTAVPEQAEDAWSWDEFAQLARQLRGKLPAEKYPFVYNWQGNGVTRWLSWLFQADGRFLSPDLTQPEIESEAGRRALDFTKAFFPDKLVPPNSSVKSTTYAADIWYSGTTVMTSGGAFLLPDAEQTVDFEWGATFLPRNKRGGGDFGGNALVATAATQKPQLATKFLEFVTGADLMREFCAAASLLPTRRDLVEGGIEFDVRPDLSDVFIGQSKVVQPQDVAQVASPNMAKIIAALKDQLELAFVGGQSTPETLTKLTASIQQAVAS